MLEVVLSNTDEHADWIETICLTRSSNATPLHFIESNANDFANFREVQVTLALNTMKRRRDTLGELYPFEVDELAVRVDRSPLGSVYVALLMLSRTTGGTPWHSSSTIAAHAEFLENVSCFAVEALLGPGSKSLPFGWPSKVGRPAEFENAVTWLASKMRLDVGSGYRPPRRKDGGVDVVGWRPFRDGRTGFPIALVQCTIQNDYVSKSRDIDLRLWSSWLAVDRDPYVVLAIPRIVPPGPTWSEIAANSVLLDRVRLTELCGGHTDDSIEAFNSAELVNLRTKLEL
jgi:hypothetical protein